MMLTAVDLEDVQRALVLLHSIGFRSIIGSFELINMCISLPHPLNRDELALSDPLLPSFLHGRTKAHNSIMSC
eukprot:6486610-Amphidinium_carterae.1